MGGTAMEMAGEHVGGVLANRMLGKVLTTPEALPILSNGLKNNVNPAIVTNQLKSVIAKADPTWAAKMGETLSNLWHDESGQLNIPGTNTQTVGTAEGAKADTAFFQRAKEELGADASFSDVAKRAQEMKSQSQGPTMNYEHDQTGKFGNLHHMVTTTQNGAKIGELAAQDTGPGVATIRSNQIYDEANRGKGYGKAQLMHLLTNAIDSDVKTVNSDISTTGAAQNVWNSLEKRFPDAVTKKEYADGRPQWSVNLKALKERMDFEGTGNYTGEERRGTERKTMNATELEDAIKNRKPINTPFNDTEGARETINRDQNMPKHPAELATSEK
jgi:predicted GNAT family acetyltransferase